MGDYSTPTYVLSLLSLLLLLRSPISALGDACTCVDCVKGKCVLDPVTGFNCICDSGWKKLTLGLITLPPCIIPNCTVDLNCGAPPSAPPPPPPPSSPPPPFNLFNPCNLILCGDGTCIVNATGSGPTAYYCQCNAGSANAANLTGLPCIKECAFGVDCSGFKIGNPTPVLPPPPPSNGMLAPPPLLPGSPPNGSNKKSWSSRSCDGFNMVLLSAVILSLVM